MKKRNKLGLIALAAAGLLAVPSASWAATIHFEGFEDPAWVAGDGTLPNAVDHSSSWNDRAGGSIDRVGSNTLESDFITSSDGNGHAVLSVIGNGQNSPYSRLGGYSSDFGLGFSVSQDIYLDTTWSNGQGFDFSTAVSNQSGAHRRDFIWHVGVVDGNLLVNANNNTDFTVNAFVLQTENGGNNFNFTDDGATTGWYTFETVFRDNGFGALAVDFNLYNSASSLLYSVTRSTATDLLSTVVGGNRYAWFTINNIDGLAIDNTQLTPVVPIPAAAPLGLLGMGLIAFMRCRKKQA